MKNKINNILEKRPDYLKDSTISFKSKLLRLVGYSLIGNPKAYNLPKDFYDMPADREMPNPKYFNQDILAKNIKTNNVRRQVLAKISDLSFKILIVLFILMFGIGFVKKGAKEVSLQKNDYTSPLKSINSKPGLRTCDDVINLYYTGQKRSITDAEMQKCGIR